MSRVSMYDEVVAAIFACQCLILMILYDKEAEGCLRMLCQRRETFNPSEGLACWMLYGKWWVGMALGGCWRVVTDSQCGFWRGGGLFGYNFVAS